MSTTPFVRRPVLPQNIYWLQSGMDTDGGGGELHLEKKTDEKIGRIENVTEFWVTKNDLIHRYNVMFVDTLSRLLSVRLVWLTRRDGYRVESSGVIKRHA